ncbi:MAG: extracellular solute-binding protein [Eubacteriales bacterium]|nr:extracellular solute-binding protein [Eubacteriales bacterium]
MKIFKRISVLLLIFVMIVGMAACGKGGEDTTTGEPTSERPVYTNDLPKDPVTLKVAFFEAGYGKEWMEYAVNTFMDNFPNVTIELTSSPSIDTIVQTKLSANDDDDMFDLFSTARITWTDYSDEGQLETVEDLWEREPYDTPGVKLKDIFLEQAYNNQRFSRLGSVYSIDFCINVMGLFYNKTLFNEKGWSNQPQNYEEFNKLCGDIKAAKMKPMIFYKSYLLGFFRPKLWELANEDGKLEEFERGYRYLEGDQYTNPYSVGTWQKFYEMGKKGYFDAGSGVDSHIVTQMKVLQNKVAMVVTGSWVQNEMKDATAGIPDFEWGFMALPLVEKAESPLYTQQGAEDSFLIWAGKPELNKKWAKEFLLWMQNMDVQMKMAESGIISIRKDFGDDPERMALIKGVGKEIYTNVLTNPDGKVRTVEILRRETELIDSNKYNETAYSTLNDMIVYIATGKKPPLPVLEDAEGWFEKALEEGYKPRK